MATRMLQTGKQAFYGLVFQDNDEIKEARLNDRKGCSGYLPRGLHPA